LECVTYLHIKPHSLGQPAYFLISQRRAVPETVNKQLGKSSRHR